MEYKLTQEDLNLVNKIQYDFESGLDATSVELNRLSDIYEELSILQGHIKEVIFEIALDNINGDED